MKIARAVLAAIAVVAGVFVAMPAGSAAADVPASNQIQYQTQSFWAYSADVSTPGIVSCPSGSRVVSSGASSNGSLNGIIPSYDYTSVTVTARFTGYMRVTVGCEQISQMSEVTSNAIGLSLGTGFRRGVVYCPAGYRAFGGGGAFIGPFDRLSTESYEMVSNTVSADGRGWTFAGRTTSTTDRLYVRTQCAPLRGSYVAQGRVPVSLSYNSVNVYAPCFSGYTALSGGVYLSRGNGDGTEVQYGSIGSSVPATGNRWYVQGVSWDSNALANQELVALTQCIL